MGPAALFASGLAAGLAAGTASCAAVQGGLLVGLVRPTSTRSGPSARAGPSIGTTTEAGANTAAVGAFLTGRLAAHTLLGGLLGLAGSAVRLGASVRAVLLVGAGLMVAVHAVRLLRRRGGVACVGGPRGRSASAERTECATCDDPTRCSGCSGGHDIPAAAPSRATRSPVRRGLALGTATLLVPCGVTITMEVAAVSSGSALAGAAALAGFALGTAPALAALGLLLRRLASSRLAVLAAVAALAAGLFTVASGLSLGGWLPGAGPAARADSVPAASAGPDGVQRITIWATERGFRPGIVTARAGLPLEIVFRTRDNYGCTRTVTVDGHDVVLPVTGQDAVRLPPRGTGDLRYACGMGMYAGFIRFI
ncbi:urease accessory protein UreH domain-containing protein [Microtetraspora malaysiensis]|uniref:Sulfite exporter TauE/SafE family protein n=1 Tax=Microtetraspora malaysiensis TaxID=161358 RepID=A0ABW6SK97_9ACTN